MSTLTLNRITKSYGEVQVLTDINIEIETGEFLVLLGPSGCGKSTLLHAIAGLHNVSSGDIVIGDRRVNDVPCQDRDIAMVFQSYALYPSMTVAQNIVFPLEMRGVSKEERKKALADVAQLLRIEPLLDRKPAQLSGGQRQRVAIGRALVRDPQLFLFDEPLSNLDALLRVEMRTELKKLHSRIGRTTVYVTHDQVEAMTLASRIAILNKGVLQQVGTPAEVYEKPANLFVAGFIGSPEITRVPGVLVLEQGRLMLKTDDCDGKSLTLPVPEHSGLTEGRKVTMGLRPEAYSIAPGQSDDPLSVTLDTHVSMIEPLGPDSIILFDFGGREAEARVAAKSGAQVGPQKIGFSIRDAVYFDTKSENLIA